MSRYAFHWAPEGRPSTPSAERVLARGDDVDVVQTDGEAKLPDDWASWWISESRADVGAGGVIVEVVRERSRSD